MLIAYIHPITPDSHGHHGGLHSVPLRPWRYNSSILEFYVVIEDQSSLKKAELIREQEETELAESAIEFIYPAPVFMLLA